MIYPKLKIRKRRLLTVERWNKPRLVYMWKTTKRKACLYALEPARITGWEALHPRFVKRFLLAFPRARAFEKKYGGGEKWQLLDLVLRRKGRNEE
jgi:hypothetical protein